MCKDVGEIAGLLQNILRNVSTENDENFHRYSCHEVDAISRIICLKKVSKQRELVRASNLKNILTGELFCTMEDKHNTSASDHSAHHSNHALQPYLALFYTRPPGCP